MPRTSRMQRGPYLGAAIALTALVLGAAHAPAALPAYSVTDLGIQVRQTDYSVPFPSYHRPLINDRGDIVFLRDTGSLAGELLYMPAGQPPRTVSMDGHLLQPTGLSANGDLVVQDWSANTASGVHATYLYNPAGGIQPYPDPFVASDINAAGVSVGVLGSTSPGTLARYTPSSGIQPVAGANQVFGPIQLAINDRGDIAGTAFYPPDHRAFYYSDATGATNLGTLGGKGSGAAAISNTGQVVGWAQTAAGYTHPFLWSPGQPMQDLGTLGAESVANSSIATDVNDLGMVVGNALAPLGGPVAFQQRAFLYTPWQGMQDLNDLVAPQTGWVLSQASGINNRGEIVGLAFHGNAFHVVRLTPASSVPEPSSLVLLGCSALSVAGWKRYQGRNGSRRPWGLMPANSGPQPRG